jgi:histidine triad (HIT) family protein
MKDCIFCKIVKGKIKSEIVFEDKEVLAFKDIKPVAKVHVLIIPKKHLLSINHLKKEDLKILPKMISAAQKIAKKFGIDKTGFRLIFNAGKDSGLTIEHLHLHLIGGEKLPWA